MAIYVNDEHKTTPWKANVSLMVLPDTTGQVWRLEAFSPSRAAAAAASSSVTDRQWNHVPF